MWLQISTVVVVLCLIRYPTQAESVGQFLTRSKVISVGIELCVNQCDDERDCCSYSHFKGTLKSGLHEKALAVVLVTRSKRRRTFFDTVLNKTSWKKCSHLHCAATRASTSLDRLNSIPVQKKTPLNRIILRKINHIAASNRYSNIVYGHGPLVGNTDRILSFSMTRSLSVGEHALDNGIIRKNKIIIQTCGLTTGPCYTGRGSCVYICFHLKDRARCRLRIFNEPDIDQDKLQIKTSFVTLTRKRRPVVSIAMDGSCVMYAMTVTMDGSKITITAFRITGNKRIQTQKVKEFDISVRSFFLDISKEDHKLLLVAETMALLSPDNLSKKDRLSRSNLHYLYIVNSLKRRGRFVCWLADGQHIVFIERKFPFKSRKVFLNPG